MGDGLVPKQMKRKNHIFFFPERLSDPTLIRQKSLRPVSLNLHPPLFVREASILLSPVSRLNPAIQTAGKFPSSMDRRQKLPEQVFLFTHPDNNGIDSAQKPKAPVDSDDTELLFVMAGNVDRHPPDSATPSFR